MAKSSRPTNSESPLQLLYPDLENELALTRRVLERYPEGKADWRPHDKSMALGALATHVAELPRLAATVLKTDEIDVADRQRNQPAKNSEELLRIFEESVGMLMPAISAATFDDLGKSWTLKFGGRALFSDTRRTLMRTLLINHVIHHRAQLGVYYRLLGIPVPGLYGPSADEPVWPGCYVPGMKAHPSFCARMRA